MPDWSNDAKCIEEDPDLFFPTGDGVRAQPQVELARMVCAECPVRLACLRFALATNIDYGVWAGTTPLERHRMRRRAKLTPNSRKLVARQRVSSPS